MPIDPPNPPGGVEDLLAKLQATEDQRRDIGAQIREGKREAVVVFVDLSDSTAMKARTNPEVWLGDVWTFLRLVEQLANVHGGTVVKRIGDEVLVTFDTPGTAEPFITALFSHAELERFRFKVAADYGEVWSVRFDPTLPLDPYGPVVDRCARIAKLAVGGSALASGSFARGVKKEATYYHAGDFRLAGFEALEPVYVRLGEHREDQDAYLQPLVKTLNSPKGRRPQFFYVPRQFSAMDFRARPTVIGGRPFLLRELLSLPHLPHTLAEFAEMIARGLSEDAYVGHLVDWEATLFSRSVDDSLLRLYCTSPLPHDIGLNLLLPIEMSDATRGFKKGDPIRFNGVLMAGQGLIGITVDYVRLTTALG